LPPHSIQRLEERQIASGQRLDRVFIKRGELRVGFASFLARGSIGPASFNLLPMKEIVQVHLRLPRSSGALPCRLGRLDQDSPGPAFRGSLHDVDPPVWPAHERGELL
jgi:hypothetical protein